MIKIKEVAFFCYAVSDMKRARAFYEGILGLRPNSEFDGHGNPNYVEYDIGGTTLAIGSAPGMWDPSEKGASAALEVEDFDEVMKAIKERDLKVVMGPNEFPTCRMIVLADPDNNRITLHKKNRK